MCVFCSSPCAALVLSCLVHFASSVLNMLFHSIYAFALSRWLPSRSLVCMRVFVLVCVCFFLHQSSSSFFICAIWSFGVWMHSVDSWLRASVPFFRDCKSVHEWRRDYIKSFFNCLDIAHGHIQSTPIVCIHITHTHTCMYSVQSLLFFRSSTFR